MLSKRSLAVLFSLVTSFAAFEAHAETVTLRYSSWVPTNHFVNTKAMMPWLEEIEKVTEGRVKGELLPKVVGTAANQFDVIRDGLADVSFMITGYTPGRFVLSEMGELPFLGDDVRVKAPAFYRTYEKHFKAIDELKGVEVMTLYTSTPGNIFTAKKEVKSAADLKGLKLRSTSQIATSSLTAVGAVPILKSSTEAFEMLSTGAIDGSLSQLETIKNFNMIDIMKYGALIPGGFYNTTHLVGINPEAWAKISPEDQKAIREISGEKLAIRLGTAFYNADMEGLEAINAKGIKVEKISAEFDAELKQALAPVEAGWVERAKAKGLADPAQVLKEFREEVAKLEAASK